MNFDELSSDTRLRQAQLALVHIAAAVTKVQDSIEHYKQAFPKANPDMPAFALADDALVALDRCDYSIRTRMAALEIRNQQGMTL